ncbi:MAG: catalase [Algisphaera sp.]
MPDTNKQMKTTGKLTTAEGRPVGDFQNSLTAGPRGPLLMQDVHLLEAMQHFNRERIPERVVHAKGSGAYGTFTVTHDITKYTKAALFAKIGKKTDMIVRFSTVAGERGAADAERDVRGFSLKFYTEEGNWDLVGNNTPVFFIRDAFKFANFIHTQKRDPKTNLRDDDMQWDFWSQCPESLHQVTYLMGDRGRPATLRNMNGYGSHTYSMVNTNNERVWVKFHFKTNQGIKNLHDAESADLIGRDRESHQRDLFEAIDKGAFPSWTLKVQVMTQTQAEGFRWNPFDLTKVWPHAEFPLIEVGQMELNRNPENYFAEVEQAAFSPSSMVPGIEPSPDKMLQARLMSYADAHRYRIGNNYQQLPVNKPKCPFANYQRDGQMATAQDYGSRPNYYPNTREEVADDTAYNECPMPLGDVVADRYDSREGHDDFTQAGMLWNLFDEDAKKRCVSAIVGGLGNARKEVQMLQLCHFFRADAEYGKRVAAALGIEVPAAAAGPH